MRAIAALAILAALLASRCEALPFPPRSAILAAPVAVILLLVALGRR